LAQRISTDDGIQIDFNDEQYENASDSIRVNFDPHSKTNEQSDRQPQKCRLHSSTVIREIHVKVKAEPSIHSSAAGIQIDSNDEQYENASLSIRRNFDPDSKLNEETDLHLKKHFAQRI
jgi:hypothetical protein